MASAPPRLRGNWTLPFLRSLLAGEEIALPDRALYEDEDDRYLHILAALDVVSALLCSRSWHNL